MGSTVESGSVSQRRTRRSPPPPPTSRPGIVDKPPSTSATATGVVAEQSNGARDDTPIHKVTVSCHYAAFHWARKLVFPSRKSGCS